MDVRQNSRISWAISATHMSAPATDLDPSSEHSAARMAVSSNTLCWLLKHQNLSARSCRLGDLQAIPWLLIDQAGRNFTKLEFAVLGFLFREAAALLAAPVLTLA